MGKGGKSHGSGGEENMAAWLVGINTLKIQPFKLPPLGTDLSLPFIHTHTHKYIYMSKYIYNLIVYTTLYGSSTVK